MRSPTKRYWLNLVTSARLATIAGLIVAAVGIWQIYLNFYAKDEAVNLSVPHAHMDFMSGRLETSLSFSNSGNTAVTIGYVVALLRAVPNPNARYTGPKDRPRQPTKADLPADKWQRIIVKPLNVPPGTIQTVTTSLCLPVQFNIKSQLQISITAYFSDYTGRLYKATFPIAKVVWTNMFAGPEHKVIGFTPVAVISETQPYKMFAYASTVTSAAAYATEWRKPDCLQTADSNIALQPTALTAGAVKVPSAGFARSGGG